MLYSRVAHRVVHYRPPLLMSYFVFAVAEVQAASPTVDKFSVVAVTPWSVLISWQKPIPTAGQVVMNYQLSGDVSKTITSSDKYMFLYHDTGINPGQNVTVTIIVNYNGGGSSDPLTKLIEMPLPSK